MKYTVRPESGEEFDAETDQPAKMVKVLLAQATGSILAGGDTRGMVRDIRDVTEANWRSLDIAKVAGLASNAVDASNKLAEARTALDERLVALIDMADMLNVAQGEVLALRQQVKSIEEQVKRRRRNRPESKPVKSLVVKL